jgi:hypothetical protein
MRLKVCLGGGYEEIAKGKVPGLKPDLTERITDLLRRENLKKKAYFNISLE